MKVFNYEIKNNGPYFKVKLIIGIIITCLSIGVVYFLDTEYDFIPKDYNKRIEIAKEQYEKSDFERAIFYFERAILPISEESKEKDINYLLRLYKKKEMNKEYNTLLKSSSKHFPMMLDRLIRELKLASNTKELIAIYEDLINPMNDNTSYEHIEQLYKLYKYTSLEEELDFITRIVENFNKDNQHIEKLFVLSKYYENFSMNNEIINLFENYVYLDNSQDELYYDNYNILLNAYLQNKMYEEANFLVEDLLNDFPDDIRFIYLSLKYDIQTNGSMEALTKLAKELRYRHVSSPEDKSSWLEAYNYAISLYKEKNLEMDGDYVKLIYSHAKLFDDPSGYVTNLEFLLEHKHYAYIADYYLEQARNEIGEAKYKEIYDSLFNYDIISENINISKFNNNISFETDFVLNYSNNYVLVNGEKILLSYRGFGVELDEPINYFTLSSSGTFDFDFKDDQIYSIKVVFPSEKYTLTYDYGNVIFPKNLDDINQIDGFEDVHTIVVNGNENKLDYDGDVKVFEQMTKLRNVWLIGNFIGDFKSFQNLEKLNNIYIRSENNLLDFDISVLSKNKKLKWVNVYLGSDKEVTGNLDSIKSLNKLRSFEFYNSNISGDISAFKDMKYLEEIILQDSNVSGNVENLVNNKFLRYANFMNSKITGDLSKFNYSYNLNIINVLGTNCTGVLDNLYDD